MELATSFTILTCSKLGLPVSTTHCVTGATAAIVLMNKSGWKTQPDGFWNCVLQLDFYRPSCCSPFVWTFVCIYRQFTTDCSLSGQSFTCINIAQYVSCKYHHHILKLQFFLAIENINSLSFILHRILFSLFN